MLSIASSVSRCIICVEASMPASPSLSADVSGVRAAAARAAREDGRRLLRAGVRERAPEKERRWHGLEHNVDSPNAAEFHLRSWALAARWSSVAMAPEYKGNHRTAMLILDRGRQQWGNSKQASKAEPRVLNAWATGADCKRHSARTIVIILSRALQEPR